MTESLRIRDCLPHDRAPGGARAGKSNEMRRA